MGAETVFWCDRYTQQVKWTLSTRRYIFKKIAAQPNHKIFEAGCGYGAVLESLRNDGFQQTTGADIIFHDLDGSLNADAHFLPLKAHAFDICLCHFLLLWVADPAAVLFEMARITKSCGWVAALAEPDYGARIDYPPPLSDLGILQTQALQNQGADVCIGRQLGSLFQKAGLTNVTTGIIGAEWKKDFNQTDFDNEWAVLRKDLKKKLSKKELDNYYNIDFEETQHGNRVLHVPIFYAFGQLRS